MRGPLEVHLSTGEVEAIRQAIPKLNLRVPPLTYNRENRISSILIGFLGEWAAFHWAHPEVPLDEWVKNATRDPRRRDDDGDLRLEGRRIEVRSRRIFSEPTLRDTFNTSYDRLPPPTRDLILFVCVSGRLHRAWLVGWLARDEWLARSYTVMPGDRLGNGPALATTLNIAIRFGDLRDMDSLAEYLRMPVHA